MRRMLTFALLAIGLAGGAAAQTMPPPVFRASDLKTADGTTIGRITVTAAPQGVLLRLEAKGLPPGWHGIHFHEKADCSGPSFQNAGGHVHSQTPVVHGLLNADANDAGDLPNIFVEPDGNATLQLYSTLVGLTNDGGKPILLGANGSSVVIHANPDDYLSQPIGGAGPRIACAEIR